MPDAPGSKQTDLLTGSSAVEGKNEIMHIKEIGLPRSNNIL